LERYAGVRAFFKKRFMQRGRKKILFKRRCHHSFKTFQQNCEYIHKNPYSRDIFDIL
jgi:hypothetical protein